MSAYKVTLGHAVSDENGNSKGGKPGDQKQNKDNTKGEVLFQDYYISGNDKWDFVARCKDPYMRNRIAEDMIYAVRNGNIGYNQDKRTTLYDAAKKFNFNCEDVTTPVDCDCSSLVTVCANYAGIPIPRDVCTANMAITYGDTKLFDLYTSDSYTKSSDKLKVGDILVRAGHHTAVVVNLLFHLTSELKMNVVGTDVRALQERLNDLQITQTPLLIDGQFGKKTDEAVRLFQKGIHATVDGIVGKTTATALGFLWQ